MLLAVDTSTRFVGLALYDGTQIISESVWQTTNHHTVEVAPAIKFLFDQSGIVYKDLEAIGVALGPGSFTSLRIGLAVVKGLALSLHIPVIGVPTLDFLAASQPLLDIPLGAILQSGRSRIAVGWYKVEKKKWVSQGEAFVTTMDEFSETIEEPIYVCGELTAKERQILARKRKIVSMASPAASLRRPGFLAELAWKNFQSGKISEVVSLSPIYLHVADPIPD